MGIYIETLFEIKLFVLGIWKMNFYPTITKMVKFLNIVYSKLTAKFVIDSFEKCSKNNRNNTF